MRESTFPRFSGIHAMCASKPPPRSRSTCNVTVVRLLPWHTNPSCTLVTTTCRAFTPWLKISPLYNKCITWNIYQLMFNYTFSYLAFGPESTSWMLQDPLPLCMVSTRYAHLMLIKCVNVIQAFRKYLFTQGIHISHFCLQATCIARNNIQHGPICFRMGPG